MVTANEAYRAAVLRHQIALRQYSQGVLARVIRLLSDADTELSMKLRARLGKFPIGGRIDFTTERWKSLLDDIKAARGTAMQQYKDLLRGDLSTLGVDEAQREIDTLEKAIPIEVSFANVAATQLRAIATKRPFQGRHLNEWFKNLETTDQARLVQALQLGMSQGETLDQIVARVVGTRAQQYSDGILAITRRDASAIARTAINHVSNAARQEVWNANSDVIQCMIWHATLDGRTSAICRSRDGHGTPIGDNDLPDGVPELSPPGATPPAHINCRSVLVAYIDGVGLVGKRPYVTDTRTPDQRTVDFRALAKQNGTTMQEERDSWAATNIGRVPAATTYQDFLSSQSAAFQNKVLGRSRGALFRDGGLTLDQFVDRAGNELNLDQLRASDPDAFMAAGL